MVLWNVHGNLKEGKKHTPVTGHAKGPLELAARVRGNDEY